MRIATGKVISGKIVVEGESLEEGTTVTVLMRESDETFDSSPEEEARLREALAEAERGETVDGHSLVRDLRSRS